MRQIFLIAILVCGAGFAGANLSVRAQTNPPAPINPMLQAIQSLPPMNVGLPVTASVELDPPVVAVGEDSYFRIRFNALAAAVTGPLELTVPPGLELIPGARGQILQFTNGETRPVTAWNYKLRAAQPGNYAIPTFLCEVNGKPLFAPGATLTVTTNLEANRPRARRLILKPARTNVFAGETLAVFTHLLPSAANTLEGLTALQFNGDGFLESKNTFRQHIKSVELDGRKQMAYVNESQLTPLATGPQKLSVQAFTAGSQFSGPIVITGTTTIPGGPPRYTLLESDPVTIQVRPLPADGRLPGFAGFIGNISMSRPQLSTNALRVGDALRLTITYRSDQSLARLQPPEPPRAAGWEIFPGAVTDTLPAADAAEKENVTFAYTMIPLTPELQRTPPIPFSVFDREQMAYVDRSIPALDIRIITEGVPADWKLENWTAGESRTETAPVLGQLAKSPGKSVGSLVPLQFRPWFFALQLAPAIALLGLWLWDRERRFLEAHPEVLRRRQARRALRRERRELRRAAAAGDAAGFVRRAVAALQIAAAPHFPAAPRALVCGEILSLVSEPERGGRTGEVIRSLFARDEATSFAREPENSAPLFALLPDLEQILTQMEERL